PRAIKRTTRTELHHEDSYIAKYIYWNTGIKPTATCVTASYICKQMLCYGDLSLLKLSFAPYRLIK
ncbi:MAG: hypothetical protein ACFN0J_06240, partial [Segatella salivae]